MVYFSFGIGIDCQGCHDNCTILRASGWEGSCLWESVLLWSAYWVPGYLLPCSLGGASDEVRAGDSTVPNFLSPRAGPHCGLLPDGKVLSGDLWVSRGYCLLTVDLAWV